MIRQITLSVRVVTPIHIGTGRKLIRDFDFVTKNGRTYRIREEGLIDELYTRDPKLTEQLMRTPPGRLLKPEDLTDDSPFVRYVLHGIPGGSEFREQLKDAHDRPYLPGSSLKGALRTVLAWHGWKEEGLTLSSVRLDRRPKYAAREVEKKLFGKDPHHDLLRALRISDSSPVPVDTLVIENVNVWTKRGAAAPISVEAIQEGTEFTVHVSIDESVFSKWASKMPGFPLPHRDWLNSLPEIARARAAERLQREIAWWKGRPQPEKLGELQSALRNAANNAFPLQLGFGTGWEGTTIGAPLKTDLSWPKVYNFRDNRGRRWFKHELLNPRHFPVSRQVIVLDKDRAIPFGWVWITWMEE